MTSIQNHSTKALFFYIIIAYIFSILVRILWVVQSGDNSQLFWNGQFMINTNDGYFWAEGARDIVAGFHQENDLSPINQTASWLTALIYWMTPFSLESVIFYMPAFLSSLVVIPVILIGRALCQLHTGFIAALLSSIAWSYYNRTMAGYFDTDMLNIVLPVMLLWTLVLAFQTRAQRYSLFMALDIIAYRLWYPQSYSLEFAFFGLILLYVLIYERKNSFLVQLLTLMLLAMMGLPIWMRVILVIAVYLSCKRAFYTKFLYHFLIASILLFMFSGGLDPIWSQLKGYVFTDAVKTTQEGIKLHYFSVMQTVSEAGKIPFEMFANRISGHTTLFIFSIVGYIWMAWRFRVMLLGLPLIGLGFLAYGIPGVISGGGLRFTIYAIVPLAFGAAYAVVMIAKFIAQKNKRFVTESYIAVVVAGSIALLAPNLYHVYDYNKSIATVMKADEVKLLDELKSRADREDYVMSWWDYGYPIRFYSDVKTFVDGGKHSGEVNFPVSLALTGSQEISAKIARITAEEGERRFKLAKEAEEKGEVYENNLTFMQELFTKNALESTDDLMDYLEALSPSDLNKSRDIYFYLPFQMTRIFPVVEKFSLIDLVSGEKKTPMLFKSFQLQDAPDRLVLAPNLYVSKRDGQLYNDGRRIPLGTVYQTMYDKDLKLRVNKSLVSISGKYHLMILSSYGMALLLDDKALNSTFVQLFFLEQYDKHLFEPAIMSPLAKIYKLKI